MFKIVGTCKQKTSSKKKKDLEWQKERKEHLKTSSTLHSGTLNNQLSRLKENWNIERQFDCSLKIRANSNALECHIQDITPLLASLRSHAWKLEKHLNDGNAFNALVLHSFCKLPYALSTLTSKDFSVDETPDKLCGQLFWTDQMPNMDDTQLLSPTMWSL